MEALVGVGLAVARGESDLLLLHGQLLDERRNLELETLGSTDLRDRFDLVAVLEAQAQVVGAHLKLGAAQDLDLDLVDFAATGLLLEGLVRTGSIASQRNLPLELVRYSSTMSRT